MSESQNIFSLLPYIGIFAAAVGAGVSALMSNIISKSDFKRRTKVTRIERRLDVYSYLIYHLDEMAYHHKGLSYTQRRDLIEEERYVIPKEWEKIIKEIDNKLRDNYFLVEHDIVELWTWVKTQAYHPIALDIMPDLRNRLIENYNEIVERHKKELYIDIPMIHKKELDIDLGYSDSITLKEEQTIKGIVLDSENKKGIIGVKVTIQILDGINNILHNEYQTTDLDGKFQFVWNVESKLGGEHSIILRASTKGYDIKLLRKIFQVKTTHESNSNTK